jgi:hypothetical protein
MLELASLAMELGGVCRTLIKAMKDIDSYVPPEDSHDPYCDIATHSKRVARQALDDRYV